jgi:hypothetical protein
MDLGPIGILHPPLADVASLYKKAFA